MTRSNQITADLASKEDIDRILELNTIEYGPTDILANRADFAWLYADNPAGEAWIPVIRDDQGLVIGFIWILPLRFLIAGKEYLGASGRYLVVHPEYRKTMAYVQLMRRFEQVFQENSLSFHFSFVSESEYQRAKRDATDRAWTVPTLVKPLNVDFLLQAHSKAGILQVARKIGLLGVRFLFSPLLPSNDQGISIQQLSEFDSRFDEFWTKVQSKYPLMVIRDQSFLAWRFTNISGRKYQILIAQAAGQMYGYAVLRCSSIRNIKVGLVLDFLVTDDEFGKKAGELLLAEAESYFRTQEMSLIVGIMPSFTAEYRLLRRAGYIHWPSTYLPRPLRFVYFVHNSSPPDLPLLSAQNWFITLADYESQ
jgi:GNAT superfamily N-acetyltransferase